MLLRVTCVILSLLVASCVAGPLPREEADAGGEAGNDGHDDVDVRVRDVCAGVTPICFRSCADHLGAPATCVGDRWRCPAGSVSEPDCRCVGLACFPRPDGGAAGHSG